MPVGGRPTTADGSGHRARGRRGRHVLDAHLLERVAHRVDGVTHLVGPDRADATDAKRLDLRELARVEDEALVAHAIVELAEAVAWVRRRVEGDDDRRLDPWVEERPEAQL